MDGRSRRKIEVPIRKCEECGKEIIRNTTSKGRRIPLKQYVKTRFCSEKCFGINQSKNNKGKNNPNWRGGKSKCCLCGNELSARYSYRKNKLGTNFCRKCSHIYFRGENSWSWKGGISSRIHNSFYTNWRLSVFERDDFTCQKCGDNKGGNLNAHHIERWATNKELRLDSNNGITLCVDCHRKFHKQFGHKQTNKENLNKFLQ